MFEDVEEVKLSKGDLFTNPVLQGSEYAGTIEFSNGYSLSIVRHNGSYGGKQGLFEIMLMKNGEPKSMTPITSGDDTVRGFMIYDDVLETIQSVKELTDTV